MKVCVIAPVHCWDDVRVFHKQAVSLAQSGFDVTLLSRADRQFLLKGVSVLPVRILKGKGRIFRFLSIPLIFFQALSVRADVYHTHNPDTIPIAWFLKLAGKRVIYDTHEDFSARLMMRTWIPKYLRWMVSQTVGFLEAFTAKVCDAAIVTQSDMLSRFGKKTCVIGNAPRIDDELMGKVDAQLDSIPSKGDDFRLVYIGGVAFSRGLIEMVDALHSINKRFTCRLWLIGPANKDELAMAQNKTGWKYVDYYPRMPQEKAFAFVSKSDVGLICIHDIGDHSKTDPNKLYEYMALAKPFVATRFEAWLGKVGAANAGFFVEGPEVSEITRAVGELYDMGEAARVEMGVRGRRFVETYNWDFEFVKLKEVYDRLFLV